MSNNDIMVLYQQACATLDEKVSNFHRKFQEQMLCRNGCSSCCENAKFRIRLVEAQALLTAYQQSPVNVRQTIQEQITQPKAGHEDDCPLLINGSCSLYTARPTLCRAYGALVKTNDSISTCALNFNHIPAGLTLEVIELDPFYEVMDELSAKIWKQSNEAQTTEAPVFSIRDFFEGKLKHS